jgi:antitoxin component of MazEF toxin-antitoxin module
MKVGKVLKIGDSLGIVIPRPILRKLSWWQHDYIVQEVHGDTLVLRNVTQLSVRPVHTREEYGDASVPRT